MQFSNARACVELERIAEKIRHGQLDTWYSSRASIGTVRENKLDSQIYYGTLCLPSAEAN